MSTKKTFSSDNFLVIWDKYQKPILTVLTIIILVILGWLGYQKYVVQPKEETANNALSNVQMAFQQAAMSPTVDTAAYKFVIEGEGANKGALSIIRNYGSTDAGNLAKYYAGESYLHLGDFNNAVKYN